MHKHWEALLRAKDPLAREHCLGSALIPTLHRQPLWGPRLSEEGSWSRRRRRGWRRWSFSRRNRKTGRELNPLFFFFFSLINHSSHCLFCRNLFSAVAVGFASRCYAQGGKKQTNFSANLLKSFSWNQRRLLTAFKRKQGRTSLYSGCMCRLSLGGKVQLLTSQLSQERSLMWNKKYNF